MTWLVLNNRTLAYYLFFICHELQVAQHWFGDKMAFIFHSAENTLFVIIAEVLNFGV